MSPTNRPNAAGTWEDMWAAGVAAGEYFDAKVPLPQLVHQLSTDALPRGVRALVPGCGRAYDVEALCASGRYEAVVGLDLSPTAVAAAREYLASRQVSGKYTILCGDFFDAAVLPGEFTLVYDYTFFCAIPVEWRANWGVRMARLVHVGGVLVTAMFPMGKAREEGGPPHGVSEQDYAEVLEGSGKFRRKDGPRRIEDDMVHKGREGRTYWCVWERIEG